MGCGGSKEDVATGNTVSTGQLFRKKSSTAKSTPSLTTDNSSVNNSSSSTQVIAETTEASNVASEKAIEEEKHTPEEPSDRNSSSTKEEEIIEMKTIPEEVENHLPNKEFDENKEVKNDGDEEGLKENTEAKVNETTEALDKKDETPSSLAFKLLNVVHHYNPHNSEQILAQFVGESIGQNSVDFKETISIEEIDGEVKISEKKSSEEGGEILVASSAH